MAWLSLVPAEVTEAWNDPEFEAYFRDTFRFGTPPPMTLAIEAHRPEPLRAIAEGQVIGVSASLRRQRRSMEGHSNVLATICRMTAVAISVDGFARVPRQHRF